MTHEKRQKARTSSKCENIILTSSLSLFIVSYKSSTLAKMMDIMGDVSPFLELTIWCVALLVAICTVAGNFDKGFKTEAVFVQGLELF